jgi:hypothetical protein
MGCISNKEIDKEIDKEECDNKKLKSEIELSEKITNQIITDFSSLPPSLPPRPTMNTNHIRIRVDIDDANEFIVIESENDSTKIENLHIKDNHIK